MGGPVARLTGDRAGRPPRGRQAPGAGWADADELDENAFLLARHRAGRKRLFNPEDTLLYGLMNTVNSRRTQCLIL